MGMPPRIAAPGPNLDAEETKRRSTPSAVRHDVTCAPVSTTSHEAPDAATQAAATQLAAHTGRIVAGVPPEGETWATTQLVEGRAVPGGGAPELVS